MSSFEGLKDEEIVPFQLLMMSTDGFCFHLTASSGFRDRTAAGGDAEHQRRNDHAASAASRRCSWSWCLQPPTGAADALLKAEIPVCRSARSKHKTRQLKAQNLPDQSTKTTRSKHKQHQVKPQNTRSKHKTARSKHKNHQIKAHHGNASSDQLQDLGRHVHTCVLPL